MKISSLYLIPLLLLLSCTRKVAETVQAPKEEPTPIITESPEEVKPSEEVEVDDREEAPPYLVAVIKKTECYGLCPVFEARLFSNGHLTFLGKKNTDRLGHYEAWTDSSLLEQIKAEAYRLKYFQLSDVYPANERQIEDIPMTITYLNFDEKEKTIINNYESPLALRKFETFLEQLLLNVSWKKMDGGS